MDELCSFTVCRPKLVSLSAQFVVKPAVFSTRIQFTPINLRQQLIKMTQNQFLWTKQQQFYWRIMAASWVKTCSSPVRAFLQLQLTSEVIFAHQCERTHLFLWFPFCLHQFSTALAGASPPHAVPSLPSFFLCLPKSFRGSLSSLSPSFFLANCTEVGIPQTRALLSPLLSWRVSVSALHLCYCFSGFPLVASPHPKWCLLRGLTAWG